MESYFISIETVIRGRLELGDTDKIEITKEQFDNYVRWNRIELKEDDKDFFEIPISKDNDSIMIIPFDKVTRLYVYK